MCVSVDVCLLARVELSAKGSASARVDDESGEIEAKGPSVHCKLVYR